jgi:hypothetical protein
MRVIVFNQTVHIRYFNRSSRSAGTVEQDIEVAEAASGAIEPSIQSAFVGVP